MNPSTTVHPETINIPNTTTPQPLTPANLDALLVAEASLTKPHHVRRMGNERPGESRSWSGEGMVD